MPVEDQQRQQPQNKAAQPAFVVPYRSGIDDHNQIFSEFALVRTAIYCLVLGSLFVFTTCLLISTMVTRPESIRWDMLWALLPLLMFGNGFMISVKSFRMLLRHEKCYPFQ